MFFNLFSRIRQNRLNSTAKAFTLIEIMVVLAIILILVTLVIPNILRLRINSNEIAAVSNLNTLGKAAQQYCMQNGYKYPQNLTDLTLPTSNPPYISQELASGSLSGYLFAYTYVDDDNFYVKANPKSVGKTGVRYFYLDETGVIRYNLEQEAGANDPPVK
ncbi:MAG: type II secretion system protein [Candidatus Omnitrophota bacterium]|nr:type II secretion system protein [Candidatus Omnitrophota bacterium]